jgi:vanillate O-demethylase monooxygenase subunit
MTRPRPSRPRAATSVPTDCWYAVAPGSAVGRELLGTRAVDRPVLLFRTTAGEVVALEDRCVHRPFPLSAGSLDGDRVRCGLCGFVYDADGQCVSVPTQSRVPFRASVAAYPAREVHGLVWVWFGEPGRARLHRIPELPWLDDQGWATVGDEQAVAAGFLLLHESFADVTQVPFVAPDLAPAVLHAEPPPLDVVVTETTVSFSRVFPRGRLPRWQAELVGRPPEEELDHRQEGFFLSPAVWVDHWDVQASDGAWYRLRFTHLVTPVDGSASRLMWRVSRDFAVTDAAATARLADLFGSYYRRVTAAMETVQRVVDDDGPGREVNVSADVAALKVRDIVRAMLAEEGAGRRSR